MKSIAFAIGAACGALSMMPFLLRMLVGCMLNLACIVLVRYPNASYLAIIVLPPVIISLPLAFISFKAFAGAWMVAVNAWIYLIAFRSLRGRR